MDDRLNLKIYRTWAPIYDFVMRPVYGAARRRAIELLNLQVGEKVLLPGVGTGLDLPLLPSGAQVTGIDLTPAMLEKARAKSNDKGMIFAVMNAQALQFPDDTFDAVILNLILSVVPDGAAAFAEAWRVLRPGGRVVIFDKFLPEAVQPSIFRKLLACAIRSIGTDPNRRLSDIMCNIQGLILERDEPSLLNGQYRLILIRKQRNIYS
ncbi:MAG: SAM-dependent methyltransferase [Chloroflexi bacterium HGW-Chloroflexi-4]|jgi:ubiquinone/menaquinone biosynthesis C-methylase UbiE|nr:MAG: SAM-dependent methyltransferase [Chloroflexi bacterium HGW-Chloroflexi-4]